VVCSAGGVLRQPSSNATHTIPVIPIPRRRVKETILDTIPQLPRIGSGHVAKTCGGAGLTAVGNAERNE
jgi:hypothetical protein